MLFLVYQLTPCNYTIVTYPIISDTLVQPVIRPLNIIELQHCLHGLAIVPSFWICGLLSSCSHIVCKDIHLLILGTEFPEDNQNRNFLHKACSTEVFSTT